MITRQQALQKCIEMWDWLAEHPRSDKLDYLQASKVPADKRPAQNCYACEYACRRRAKELNEPFNPQPNQHSCKYCPVWDQEDESDMTMCLHFKSPYVMWSDFPVYLYPEVASDAAYVAHRHATARAVADMSHAKLDATLQKMDDEMIYRPHNQTPEEMLKERDIEIGRMKRIIRVYRRMYR